MSQSEDMVRYKCMKKIIYPLVIGNWKMNPQTNSLATRLTTEIKKKISHIDDVEVVLAPPTVFLSAVAAVRNGKNNYKLGAQDAYWENLGAHTGETSLLMLASMGVTHVIIGHSERRAEGESDEAVNKKLRATIKNNMTGVVCVGERKRDHAAHYLNLIEKQIREACAGLSKSKLEQLVIAYEPIWAIGTGETATGEDAHEMRLFIEKVLSDLYGRNFAKKVRILYGGSVNDKNAHTLFVEGRIDGFLIGGASLRAQEFCEIVKAVRSV